jgi:hypothetical protein
VAGEAGRIEAAVKEATAASQVKIKLGQATAAQLQTTKALLATAQKEAKEAKAALDRTRRLLQTAQQGGTAASEQLAAKDAELAAKVQELEAKAAEVAAKDADLAAKAAELEGEQAITERFRNMAKNMTDKVKGQTAELQAVSRAVGKHKMNSALCRQVWLEHRDDLRCSQLDCCSHQDVHLHASLWQHTELHSLTHTQIPCSTPCMALRKPPTALPPTALPSTYAAPFLPLPPLAHPMHHSCKRA